MIVVVGIKSCDTCRKALAWLSSRDLPHTFHDLRADGLTEDQLKSWISAVSWEALLNRRSTTWRTLDDKDRADLTEAKAIRLMLDHPTLVKRPVFETESGIYVGFTDETRTAID